MGKFKKVALLSALVAAPVFFSPSFADESTGKIDVQLEIIPGCRVGDGVAAEGVKGHFGVIDFGQHAAVSTSQNVTASGTGNGSNGGLGLVVECSDVDQKSINIAVTGSTGGKDGADRTMLLDGNTSKAIPYGIYTDAARTNLVMNNANLYKDIELVNGKGELQLYGKARMPEGTKDAGIYKDTLTVEVKF